ncbi:IclR family transcriptional regulator [Derxia gummosa]|uniref:IclR family transcriptional regulator n=1 Tax=Derxia gummosa DSM 723 TaxID=1121388 RepID=A0A8B6X9M8_9BURK|nr:IclR family transcriptional regulator [Derxia gummosa]
MSVLVPAIERAAAILDLVAASQHGLTVAELAERLNLPRSSTHNLCGTLAHVGQLHREAGGRYCIGAAIARYAEAFVEQTDLTREFGHALDRLAEPDVAYLLATLDQRDTVYLAHRNGSHPIGLNFRTGMRLPAVFTATGKAVLSTLPPAEVRALMRGHWPKPLTRNSVGGVDALMAQLDEVRERGWSVDAGEVREGLFFYGAPVCAAGSARAVGAVSVSLFVSEPGAAVQERASRAVLRLAEEISMRLGGGATGTAKRPTRR